MKENVIEKWGHLMKNRFYDLADIACQSPLVVLFAFERVPLLKIILPRLVNAVRHIGGYLVVIDDKSQDERIAMILKDYEEKGWIDMAFVGKHNRHIDWIESTMVGYGRQTARRSVMLHLLAKHSAPFVIFCDADIVMPSNALEVFMRGCRIAREEGMPASHFCGFRYNKSVMEEKKRLNVEGDYFLFGWNTSMALSLVPLDVARRVDREGPTWHKGKWSLNEYALRAFRMEKLQACYVLNVPCQHVGVGHAGRTFMTVSVGNEVAAYEEDGSLMQIDGFDVNRFYDIAEHGTYLALERFAYQDHDLQVIEDVCPVHPEFYRLRDLINER